MDAALHGGDKNLTGMAKDETAGMSDGRGWRKGGDIGERDTGSVSQGIGEGAEAGAENESDLGAEGRALQNQLGGGIGVRECVGHRAAGAVVLAKQCTRNKADFSDSRREVRAEAN